MLETPQMQYVAQELNRVLFLDDDTQRIDVEASSRWELRKWIKEAITFLNADDELTPQCATLLKQEFNYEHAEESIHEYVPEDDTDAPGDEYPEDWMNDTVEEWDMFETLNEIKDLLYEIKTILLTDHPPKIRLKRSKE